MDVAEAGATDVSDLAMQERCDNDQQTSSASTPSTDAPVPQASDAQYISGKCAGNQQMVSSPMASAYLPTAKFSRMDNSKSSDSLHVTSSAVPLPAIPTAEIPDEAISVESKDGHWALMAPVVSPPIAERSDAGEPCSVLNARASSFPVPQTDPPPAEASNGGVSDEKSGTSGGKQQSIGPIVVNSDTQADKFSCMDKTDGNCSANNRASLEHCADLPVPMPPSSSCQGSLDPCRYDIVTGSIPNGDVKNQPMFTNNKKSEQCNPTQRSYARSSRYHGVSRNRWTGKFESHLWDGTFHFEGRPRKGKLVYLGGYKSEEMAGRVHDLAAIKYWGPKLKTKLNFSISEYEREIEEMKTVSREEYIASLIRKSSCFSRGASIYRGVTRKKDGRWQSRIGHVGDCKDIYLGTYGTEVEAAEAYDLAAIELKGPKAVTNFDMSNYSEEIKLWLERQQTGNLPLNENV